MGGLNQFVEETIATISPNTQRVKEARKVVDPVEPGKPINILLIGSDSRGKEQGDPGRSDSITWCTWTTSSGSSRCCPSPVTST